jgi:hypothetical protein
LVKSPPRKRPRTKVHTNRLALRLRVSVSMVGRFVVGEPRAGGSGTRQWTS